MRSFPVMAGEYLRRVPWGFVAPHADQARLNNGFPLDRLALLGGLMPSELLAAVLGQPWDESLVENAEQVLVCCLARWIQAGGCR